jgi:polysaccharide deacetylase family protein (PEP-CTERM system associated)
VVTVHALSFDIEEYFHSQNFDGRIGIGDWAALPSRVEPYTRRILDRLDAAGHRATFFILGWVAERHPHLVKAIAGLGHEIASHGHGHRLVYMQNTNDFRADVHRAKRTLEDLSGVAVQGYRAPTYSIVRRSLWALDVLAEEGYRYDSSIFPIRHDRYGVPEAPRFPFALPNGLVEFPLSTWSWAGLRLPIAGGGYFRLLPYPIVRAAFGTLERSGRVGVFYLHPWDLDARQPVAPLSVLLRLRQTVGAAGTERKLTRLLRDFRFAPLHQVLERLPIAAAALCV